MACVEGYLPIAPHLLFPQFLNEGIEEERRLGITMGMELLALCDEVWVFGEATEGIYTVYFRFLKIMVIVPLAAIAFSTLQEIER